MDLKAIYYSTKTYNMNISKDMKYLSFFDKRSFIAELSTGKILSDFKYSTNHNVSFLSDSKVVYQSFDSLFIRDFITEKKFPIIRQSAHNSFEFSKPLVYDNSVYYFFGNSKSSRKFCRWNDGKTEELFSLDTSHNPHTVIDNGICYICDFDKSNNSIVIRTYNLENSQIFDESFKLQETEGVAMAAYIPQKDLIVAVVSTKKTRKGLRVRFYRKSSFEFLFEKKEPEMRFVPIKMVLMCNGRYVVIPHAYGFYVYDTENFDDNKKINLFSPCFTISCDNDNFCFVRSSIDLILFTPVLSPENEKLMSDIEQCIQNVKGTSKQSGNNQGEQSGDGSEQSGDGSKQSGGRFYD